MVASLEALANLETTLLLIPLYFGSFVDLTLCLFSNFLDDVAMRRGQLTGGAWEDDNLQPLSKIKAVQYGHVLT
jgi:hypothetical protein